MTLVFNERGLKDVSPPCVAQTFVPHGAVLFKLYVLGNQFSVVERPSLKNFKACDSDTIFFNSHDVSKPTSASSLSKLDEEDKGHVVNRPTDEEMAKISHAVREVFSLRLVGIDVIVDKETGKYGIIDVNAFPGYEGSPGFPEMFCSMIKKALEDTEKQTNESKNCFNDTVMTFQNGASTFQPKQNGSSDQNDAEVSSSNGFNSNCTKHKQEPKGVSTEGVPLKKTKLYDPRSECDSSTPEIKMKSGPRSLSPDH